MQRVLAHYDQTWEEAMAEDEAALERPDQTRARLRRLHDELIFIDSKVKLPARDCLHLAVMQHEGVKRIMTFDRGFDAAEGIGRISA